MALGLLMTDNTPVDYPFRRSGSAMEQSVRLGFVPGGPYYPRSMGYVPGGPYYPNAAIARRAQFAGRRFAGYGIPPRQAARVPQYNGGGFGWVDATGGGDDGTEPSPVPGTVTEHESSGWDKIATGVLNLGTSITNAVAGSIQPHSGAAGAYCPSGYYLYNGRCVPAQGGGGIPTGLILGGVALVAAVVLLRK